MTQSEKELTAALQITLDIIHKTCIVIDAYIATPDEHNRRMMLVEQSARAMYQVKKLDELRSKVYTEHEVKELIISFNKSHALSIAGSYLEKWWDKNK